MLFCLCSPPTQKKSSLEPQIIQQLFLSQFWCGKLLVVNNHIYIDLLFQIYYFFLHQSYSVTLQLWQEFMNQKKLIGPPIAPHPCFIQICLITFIVSFFISSPNMSLASPQFYPPKKKKLGCYILNQLIILLIIFIQ